MTIDRDDAFWAGSLWVYQADITNGAGGAGDNSYTVTVGVGNELELLYGELFNGDTSARTVTVEIDDGTNRIAQLLNVAADAAKRHGFPINDDISTGGGVVAGGGRRFILAGAMRLIVTIAAVALSQDSALGLVCRIRGGAPTVVEAGASTPTININTEQTF